MSNCRFPSATPDASGHPYGNLFGVRGAALRLIPSKYTEGLPGWLLTAEDAEDTEAEGRGERANFKIRRVRRLCTLTFNGR
jgi:hypothetical protein